MLDQSLIKVIKKYQKSFSEKVFEDEESDSDILMEIFGVTSILKSQNRQYWGRELGKCWESIVVEVFKTHCPERYQKPFKDDRREPCDLIVGKFAIDTKYRVGSGDASTLSAFRENANLIRQKGFEPVLLFVRDDNLSAAMTAFRAGNWQIYMGDDSFSFILRESGFDLKHWLQSNKDLFLISQN